MPSCLFLCVIGVDRWGGGISFSFGWHLNPVPLVSVYILVCTCGTVYSTVYKYTVFQPVPLSSSTRTGCSQVSSRFHYISKSHVVFIIKLNAHRLAKNIFKMDCQFALRRSLKICIFCVTTFLRLKYQS